MCQFALKIRILISRLQYKKAKKIGPQTHLTEGKRQFLRSALEIVIAKLKWDKEADPDDMDVDDLTAFDNMRKVGEPPLLTLLGSRSDFFLKELRSFAESILILDEELAVSALQSSAINILSAYERRDAIEWQDLELAVHLVFLFGELQRPGRGEVYGFYII